MKLLFDDSSKDSLFKVVPETDFESYWLEKNLPTLRFLRVFSSELENEHITVFIESLSNADVFEIADDFRGRGQVK